VEDGDLKPATRQNVSVEFPEENASFLNNERDLSESENWMISGEAVKSLTTGTIHRSTDVVVRSGGESHESQTDEDVHFTSSREPATERGTLILAYLH
jgi:hypothetical protein